MDYKNKIETAFNNFDGKKLSSLDGFYDNSVEFQDPVTHIKGLENLKKYYASAYKNVEFIHFHFQDYILENDQVGASWIMSIKIRGFKKSAEYKVPGFSHFRFNKEGKVLFHRDYLDMGALVYEHVPLLGTMVGYVKKVLRHGS